MKTMPSALIMLAMLCMPSASSAQHWTTDLYLSKQFNDIKLSATSCPGGGTRVFVIGHRSDVNKCIDVDYRAQCPGPHNSYAQGTMRNYVGGASCYGDSSEMRRALSMTCQPEDMKVWVTDVRYCR